MAPKSADYVYLVVGTLATWYVAEYERGNRPEIKLMWAAVKVLRATRLAVLHAEKALMMAIDQALEV